jgi:trk system potassium uptake protein TrkH
MKHFSLVLLFPAIVALWYKEFQAVPSFLITAFAIMLLASLLKRIVPGAKNIKSINDIKKSEGLTVVTFSWIFAGLFASVPYLFYGITPINALFEAFSGITTTGATAFTTFDYPHALLFWRSFTQWLGGMGIIVLFIAVLPQFAIAGRQLFFAEAPGPTEEKFTPRIKSTAAALWKVYAGLTLLDFILLKAFGMSGFYALCNSFSSLSGGGFSPSSTSLIGYSHNILWTLTFFMFFAGANFNLQYKAWTKFNPFLLFQNEEFKTYFIVVFVIAILLAGSLFANMHYTFSDSFVHSFFNVSSLVSSTGFCSADYAKWDYTSKILLFTIMLFGSCASSAGGGLKVTRWLLIFKIMKSEMMKILHPRAVYNIKIGNYTVPKEILYQTLMFVSFYFAFIVLSAFLIAIIEKDTIIAVVGSVAAVGNIGPGLGQVIGPMGSFAGLSSLTKTILMVDMLAGRLELIPFLVLFQKDLWVFRNK